MKTNVEGIVIPDFMVFIKCVNLPNVYTVSDISRVANITYSHVSHIKKSLLQLGWIRGERSGRIVMLELTKKGEKIYELVDILFQELGVKTSDIKDFKETNKQPLGHTLEAQAKEIMKFDDENGDELELR